MLDSPIPLLDQETISLKSWGGTQPVIPANAPVIPAKAGIYRLNRAVGGQAQYHAPVILAAKLHDESLPVGHGLRVPVEPLQGN